MAVDIDSTDGRLIRTMIPFSTMPNNVFKVICDKITIETVKSGQFLFKRGDTEKELIYLIKGEVSLEVDKLKMEIIKTGTESARFALAHQFPRKVNAVAKGTVRYFRLNHIFISQPPKIEKKTELKRQPSRENCDNWLPTLLMAPLLRKLTPENLQAVMNVMEEIHYDAGEVIIHYGDEGDYYYLIDRGECEISTQGIDSKTEFQAAKLKRWNCFGETALITNQPCDYTVVALTQICLLRVNKPDFLALIKQPLLKFVNDQQMEQLQQQGAILLDVREAESYELLHLQHAINLPLTTLRSRIKELTQDQPLIIISDHIESAELSGFILLNYGFNVQILRSDPQTESLSTQTITSAPDELFTHSLFADADLFNLESFQTSAPPISTPYSDHSFIPLATPPVNPVVELQNQIDKLNSENQALRHKLKLFKQKLMRVEQEKRELTDKYHLVLKQYERLNSLFDSLTKRPNDNQID
jgi:CRP-like cAMP-binding protein